MWARRRRAKARSASSWRSDDGEVINCVSVQVYREIEIATAKVSVRERRGVPHHLLDFVAPGERYTAGDWARDAVRTINDIESRGKCAFIVGGSGLYLRALRRPFFESPPTDELIRQRIVALRQKRGADHLYKLLARLDARSAARLHARDWSRVQRALEYRLQTGRAFAEAQRAAQEVSPPAFTARLHVFALNPPRAALYERINLRTAEHYRQGLVEEVRGLPRGASALTQAPWAPTVTGARLSICAASGRAWRAPSSRASRTSDTTPNASSPGFAANRAFIGRWLWRRPGVQKHVAAHVAELLRSD
ncbi:MAG: tRNA (adenosine(37)-N6)-dimethylallyltransferase MiaA [Pyrinomonadaceae bacterium]